MNKRQKNKHSGLHCVHHQHESFLVTDDPYNIYNWEDYCKLGKFDLTWESPDNYPEVHPCDICKKKSISLKSIRNARKQYKEDMRFWSGIREII